MSDYNNRVFCFCCGKELTNSDDWIMSFVDEKGAPLMEFPYYRLFCKRCYDMGGSKNMDDYIKRSDALNAVVGYDNEERIKTIHTANVRPVPAGGIGEMSDGYHTFNGLYYQRMVLFAALVKQNKDSAWKSHRHEDGELCFGGGWFIVGIDTPDGSYTYHYEDKDWDLFDCEELPAGKHWDGHTEDDVTRLLSLPEVRPVVRGEWVEHTYILYDGKPGYSIECTACHEEFTEVNLREKPSKTNFCPNCGAKMEGRPTE